MGDRKAPRKPPSEGGPSQVKPAPPPAPPPKRTPVVSVIANTTIKVGSCYVFSGEPIVCFLCKQTVPANVHHNCAIDNGVLTVRNRRAQTR